MRELKWSLRCMRGFYVLLLGILAVVLFLVNEVTNGKNLLEMFYRMLFVMLQLVMCVLLSERFSVVFRRAQFHRFYRSLPKAWEKERCRFLWIDGFFLVCAAVVFAIGVVFRENLTGGTVPTMLVLLFFAHSVIAKVLAVLPWWLWWIQEIVFFWLFLLLPMESIPIGVGIGAVGVYFIIQFFLYRLLKEYWYTEE